MNIEERMGAGVLHRLERQGKCLRLDSPFTVPNGPAFSLDGMRLYLADKSWTSRMAGLSVGETSSASPRPRATRTA